MKKLSHQQHNSLPRPFDAVRWIGSLLLLVLSVLVPVRGFLVSPHHQHEGLAGTVRSSLGITTSVAGALIDRSRKRRRRTTTAPLGGTAMDDRATAATDFDVSPRPPTTLEAYEYDGWNLTYRTIANYDDDDDDDTGATGSIGDHHNVLLIHPVGIGLASWFWEPVLVALRDKTGSSTKTTTTTTTRAYAPNLIGCGISEGSDAWDPDERGLFVPLSWAKGCEALMNEIDDRDRDEGLENNNPSSSSSSSSLSRQRRWTIVTQGGLAPVGVVLAARNPLSIRKLVLASPPTWEDMTVPVPVEELERNYGFLRSKILGGLAFSLLETRKLVEFFSNLFLFTGECDETWLDNTEKEFCKEARPPVQNFNAGMCMNRGFEKELTGDIREGIPSVVVVQGEGDKRQRGEYEENIGTNCKLVTLPGTNVVPWENPDSFADLLLED